MQDKIELRAVTINSVSDKDFLTIYSNINVDLVLFDSESGLVERKKQIVNLNGLLNHIDSQNDKPVIIKGNSVFCIKKYCNQNILKYEHTGEELFLIKDDEIYSYLFDSEYIDSDIEPYAHPYDYGISIKRIEISSAITSYKKYIVNKYGKFYNVVSTLKPTLDYLGESYSSEELALSFME